MNATIENKVTVTLDSIYDAMRECFAASMKNTHWNAVTVGTDGTPYCREEVSPCYSESEYFGKGIPYPVTVWTRKGDMDGLSDDEIESEMEAFDPADEFTGYGGIDAIIGILETAGFAVEI